LRFICSNTGPCEESWQQLYANCTQRLLSARLDSMRRASLTRCQFASDTKVSACTAWNWMEEHTACRKKCTFRFVCL